MRCYSCRKYDDCERPWKCDGTMYDCTAYELEQTNEEWFCGLSTEEKAEFSMRVFKNCTWCLDGGSPQECPFNEFLNCPAESKGNMMKWLEEIHNDGKKIVP